jgi:putative DNA primase/helicase
LSAIQKMAGVGRQAVGRRHCRRGQALGKENDPGVFTAGDLEGSRGAEKFARQSLDTKRITNALREAQDQAYVLPDHLDQNPYLLNFLNCTIGLRTGARREHRREDLITKIVHFNYRPDAECPRFMQFLEEVTGGGPDASEAQLERSGRLISYLQIALGYSLTGNTSEKAVFLLYGPRDNGKSTLLATFLKLLEEYSVLLQIDTLMIKPGGETNNSQADLADLRGARFVMTSETEEGQRLSEGKLKRSSENILFSRFRSVRG